MRDLSLPEPIEAYFEADRRGGQAVAQAPVQVLLVPVSACHRYSVRPLASTRIEPRPVLATLTVLDDAPADG